MNDIDITTVGIGRKINLDKKPICVACTVLFHPELSCIGDITILSKAGAATTSRVSRLEPLFHTPHGENKGPLATPFVSRTPFEIAIKKDGSLQIHVPAAIELSINGTPALKAQSCAFSKADV